ncbi:predicted protein [Micromonas commoda]|uniref:O-fucosyltransferase family protein n=1 Tax=Micromonas commoda (strain RCC299 / NOUM17 / CCMP2709) TaxID=296587 RepID=C1E2L0_MICCC|nr:predicted protein [Micromonas commoda]ACO62364.1 predicted protein [Micromonas commoda]|eukprot:XP_002501106.1 predicted protein [Micromonas commoda]
MRAPLFGDAPGGERPSRGNRDSSSRHGSDSSGWLSGTATRNTALVSCAFLLMLAAMGQMGTEREWNSGLREMVRSRIEAAGLASAVRQVQTLEEISDGAAHRGERGMRRGGTGTERGSAPPPPKIFDIKLRGEEDGDAETRRGSVKSEIIEVKTTLAPPPPSSPDEPVASTTRASPVSEAKVKTPNEQEVGRGETEGGDGKAWFDDPPANAVAGDETPAAEAPDADLGKTKGSELATTEAAFARFNRIRRLDERLGAACEPCFGAAFERHAKLYEDKTRVLVLEGRWDNGLGNNMERWRALFSFGESAGWAVYVDAGGCGAGTGRPDGGENCHFDPGHYFTGDGFDWRWHPAREKEFDALFGRETPMRTFHHMCRKDHENAHRRACQLTEHGWPSNADSAKIQPNAVGHNGYEEDPGGGEPAQNDAWLHEWLNSDEVLGWRYVKLKLRTPYDLQNEAEASEVRDYGACEIDGEKVEGEVEGLLLARKCRAQHFFRPTRALMRAMAPVLRQMDAWAGVAAVHIRTGFADWQEYWLTKVKPKDSTEIAAMEGKYSCDPTAIVRNLGAVFRQCNGRYDEQVCTNWWNLPDRIERVEGDSPRGPTSEDALVGCGDLPPERDEARGEVEDEGAVAAAATCAARLAKAAAGGSDRWGVFVLGDSPAVIKALARIPSLKGRVAYQRDEDVVGVTFRPAQCDGAGCVGAGHSLDEDRVGEDKEEEEEEEEEEGNRAWMRAVVDMYVASLADADVQLPGSSFMSSGALGLSVTNVRANALGFGGEVVMDQTVTPIGETKERSAGFHENYENYVLLSASHCEFDDERGGGGGGGGV